MAEPAAKKDIVDIGLDQGAARLTPEKIEKVINTVLAGETGARLKVYVETCVHCGLCSEGCHYYLSHDNDPKYSPVGKVKQTMWEILKKKGHVSPEFIKNASHIASTECNLCKRCSHVLPLRHRHRIHHDHGSADLPHAGRHTPLYSRHRAQPFGDHEPDVGERR